MFPGQRTQGQPHNVVRSSDRLEVDRIVTAAGDGVAVLFFPAESSGGESSGGTVEGAGGVTALFFYGNAMCAADAVGFAEKLRARGVNVAVLEYPGYGMSSGSPSEASIVPAARAMHAHVAGKPGVDPRRIVPVGLSVGGGPATRLAADAQGTELEVAGLVTISTFTSMDAMGRRVVPILPMSFVLPSHFRNIDHVGAFDGPYLIAHGTSDGIIPFAMADELEAAAKGPVTRLDVEGAGHNDVFERGGEAFWDDLAGWIKAREPVGGPAGG